MKRYTESNPVYSDSVMITETTDMAHADNVNAATKQLLQNSVIDHASITLLLEQMAETNRILEQIVSTGVITAPMILDNGDYLVTEAGDELMAEIKL